MSDRDVPAAGYPRYRRGDLERAGVAILGAVGVSEDVALTTARLLVDADAQGVSTHGLVRLAPYVQRIRCGVVTATPDIRRTSPRPGITLLDGDDGLGQAVAFEATEEVIREGRAHGVAIVGVRNSHHLGMCGLYAREIAQAGLVGIVLSNAAPLMSPTGSYERLLGNNPISLSIPRQQPEQPVVLDISLSQASYGKVQELVRDGRPIPAGWLRDDEGNQVVDPDKALSGVMTPVGDHKGYGLALIVELLAGAMTGSHTLDHVASLFRLPMTKMRVGHLLIAFDPTVFLGEDAYFRNVDGVIERVKRAERLPGVDEIVVPGEPEMKAAEVASRLGVPVPAAVIDELSGLAEELGVEIPELGPLQESRPS